MGIARYFYTIRYLKPIQVFSRVWFVLHKPSVRLVSITALRKKTGIWVSPVVRETSMLSPTRFRFLNEEHDLSSVSDWNNSVWEKLWLYHLHYFDDLNAADAVVRADWHRDLMARWITENPVGRGNGWEPYPISRRVVNWIKWGLAGNVLPKAAVENLAVQARFLYKRLEWHLLGNHLLANAKALIYAGLFYEGDEADHWLKKGASIFLRQLKEQVLDDGGHFERSPMYHAQVLEDILDVLNAVNAFSNCAFSDREDVLRQCESVSGNMLEWLRTMCHPDGQIVLFNDAALGDAADLAALEEYAAHLHVVESKPQPTCGPGGAVRFTHLSDTGYVRVDGDDMTAFLDVASIGPDYLPGHAHADTLSFELSLGRQRVIVDSGISRYGEGPERLRQRGTAAHNTVAIDGQDSSEVWGGFRVARRAYPFDLKMDADEGIVSCAHDGYRRLAGSPVHRREWRFGAHGLCVHDRIEGSFRCAVGRFHFHPELEVISSSDSCKAGKIILPGGRQMTWHIESGRGGLIEKTWHPEFGVSLPNKCLEVYFGGPETRIEFSW